MPSSHGRPAYLIDVSGLFPVPPTLLRTAARAAGRMEIYERLAGSLVADPAALIRLGWKPPVTTAQALAALARS